MPRTFDEIMAEADKHRLILCSLYQLRTFPADKHVPVKPTGEWQAEFYHQGGHRDMGRGMSAIEAMESALERAKGLLGQENRPDTPLKRSPAGEVDAPVTKLALTDLL